MKSSAASTDDEVLSSSASSSIPVPVVSEEDGVLTLHFESAYVQSQMILDDPDSLALSYTRTMMAFEIFKPNPQKIAMIGLGGGSMAKWLYRHHPKAKITVVEINPHVIAFRDRFHIPKDDARFRILCDDGTKFVAKTTSKLDVLIVDGFGADHLPEELTTQRFYDDCYQSLTGSGLMMVNLCGEGHKRTIARIGRSFQGKILLLPVEDDGNTVLYACKGDLLWPKGESFGSFQMKLKKFEKKHGLGKAMLPVG